MSPYTKLSVRTLGPATGLTREQYAEVPVREPAPAGRGTREHGTPKVVVEDWRDSGLCRGEPAELWYANEVTSESASSSYTRGKAICRECPVRKECLEWALATAEPFGLWGGLSPRARSKILRERDLAPLKARSYSSLRGRR